MSLSRKPNGGGSSRDAISYALLDSAKQQSFLNAFEKTGYKSSDKLLIAYKPRKGKFAVFTGEMTIEDVENFISSVLSGDIPFRETYKLESLHSLLVHVENTSEQRQIQMITSLLIQLIHCSANLPDALRQASSSNSVLEIPVDASYQAKCRDAVTEACSYF
ncbi:hypothetical protein RYX36_021641 [Vicia faba]